LLLATPCSKAHLFFGVLDSSQESTNFQSSFLEQNSEASQLLQQYRFHNYISVWKNHKKRDKAKMEQQSENHSSHTQQPV
jgi:hypothetical protein